MGESLTCYKPTSKLKFSFYFLTTYSSTLVFKYRCATVDQICASLSGVLTVSRVSNASLCLQKTKLSRLFASNRDQEKSYIIYSVLSKLIVKNRRTIYFSHLFLSLVPPFVLIKYFLLFFSIPSFFLVDN